MKDTEHRDNPICPYCGHEGRDAWEIDLGPGLEGDGVTDCGACGKEYYISRHATITYSTKKKGTK